MYIQTTKFHLPTSPNQHPGSGTFLEVKV